MPKPSKHQVLIKVEYSTCNPFDKMLMDRKKREGYILGSEGCGTIVELGEDLPQSYKGRKVAFVGSGWSKFCVKDTDELIFFDDSVKLEDIAEGYINPVTACAMLDCAKEKDTKAVIVNAASTNLNHMFNKLCQKESIQPINIVKDKAELAKLKNDLNPKYILSEDSDNFYDELRTLIEELKPTVFYDFVGGDSPSTILRMMPAFSQLQSMSHMSKQGLEINTLDLMAGMKKLQGFYLGLWVPKLGVEKRKQIFEFVANDFRQGGPLFGVKKPKTMHLKEWKNVMEESKNLSGQGKILMKIQ